MRRHEEKLSPEQRINLYKYFDKYPELIPIYEFKQKLTRLMLVKRRTKRQCRRLIPVYLDYVDQLKNSVFEPMALQRGFIIKWK